MNKQPGTIWYITSWGFLSGLFLHLVYILCVLIGFKLTSYAIVLIMHPFGLYTLSLMGMIPSVLIGLFASLIVWWQVRKLRPPVATSLDRKRTPVLVTIFVTTMLIHALNLWFFWRGLLISIVYNTSAQWMPVIAIIVAAFITTYGVHRYFLRLNEWSKSFDSRKSKAKNDDYYRLTDNEELINYTAHDSHTSTQEARS